MKNQILSLCALTLILFGFSSCNKGNGEIRTAISETQISYLVESALQESMAGLTAQIEAMVNIAKDNVSAQCGTTQDTTINVSNQTVIGSAEYTTNYTWSLECEGNAAPLNFDFTCHTEGNYNNNRMSSSDHGDANWELKGLSASATEFTANGNYARDGEQTIKGEGTFMESNMDIVVSNLKINKTTEEITEGTALVKVTGTADSGQTLNFEGQITFKGAGKATLVVNGKTFNLSL